MGMFERLRQPFPESSIEFVVTWSYGDTYEDVMIGVAPYIKRESVITRLDHVLGEDNWRNELSPQPYGLYNGISIRCTGGWVTKWDGAELTKSGDIDSVKSVSTQSLRRAAELWGIGLYLKELPQLFAVKRPPDAYEADEKSKINRKGQKGFTVRWDHPPIPKEFLPSYMTPEQYYLLKGLVKYFPDDKIGNVKHILGLFEADSENGNTQSVTYDMAAEKIATMRAFVDERIKTHGPKNIYPNPLGRTYNTKDKSNSHGNTNKRQPNENNKRPAPKREDDTSIQVDDDYRRTFKEARSIIVALLKESVVLKDAGINVDNIQKDYETLKESAENKTPIPKSDLQRLVRFYTSMITDLEQEGITINQPPQQ